MKYFPNSIKRSFVMVMVILVVATGLPIYLLAKRETVNARKSTTEVVKNAVELQASYLSRWIRITMEEIRAISGLWSVRTRDTKAMTVDFRSIAKDRTDIMDILYVDKTGKMMVLSVEETVNSSSISVLDRDYFNAAMRNEESISPVLVSKLDGKPIIIFSVPLLDEEKLSFDGLISGSVNVSRLSNLLSQHRFGTSGSFRLFDGAGHLLGNEMTPYEASSSPYFDFQKARSDGWLVIDDPDTGMLTYIMPIPESDLFVGGSLNIKEVLLSRIHMIGSTIGLLLLLFSIGIASFFTLLRRVSKSLDTLNRELAAVAEGDYQPFSQEELLPFPEELRYIAESMDDLKSRVRDSIEKIREQGIKDSLTGLYNRRFFEETIRDLGKGHMDPITIVMCDVNGLKLINDAMGHKWGDRLLERAKEVLLEIAEEKDTVARIGGDEFAVIMPQSDGSDTNQKFQDAMASANSKDQDIPLYMAWGIASGNASDRSIDEIVKDADDKMYALKEIQREDSRGGILQYFLRTIKHRETRKTNHMERCRGIMDRFLRTVPEVDAPFRKKMARLAAIHDIGLIGVDSEILSKVAPLEDEEMRKIRSHPEIGYRIAFAVPNMSDLADPILHHHQRWDGQGYPTRQAPISGEDIPLESRIMTLVDSYEAMTHKAYSPAKTHEEAIEEIKRCAGTQFDPEWAKKFVAFLETWEPKD